MEDILIACRRQ